MDCHIEYIVYTEGKCIGYIQLKRKNVFEREINPFPELGLESCTQKKASVVSTPNVCYTFLLYVKLLPFQPFPVHLFFQIQL